MFLESSRYYKQQTVEIVLKDSFTIKALTLRRLPVVKGTETVMKGNDRLDIISLRQYGDPAMFWHIADANTELEANDLVKKAGRVIILPEE